MKYIALVLLLFLLTACGQLTPDGTGLLFHTADPALSIGFRLLPAAPPIDIAPEVIPAEEVGEVVPEPLPTPPCVVVKGNISRDGRKLYHVEGMANFNTVKIDEAAGERFFCSPAEAEAAGWVRAGS